MGQWAYGSETLLFWTFHAEVQQSEWGTQPCQWFPVWRVPLAGGWCGVTEDPISLNLHWSRVILLTTISNTALTTNLIIPVGPNEQPNHTNTRLFRGLIIDAKWGEWCIWKALCTSLLHDQQILQWPTVCRKEDFMFVPDGWAGRQHLWEPIRSHLKVIYQLLCIRILQEFRAMKCRLGSFSVPPPHPTPQPQLW